MTNLEQVIKLNELLETGYILDWSKEDGISIDAYNIIEKDVWVRTIAGGKTITGYGIYVTDDEGYETHVVDKTNFHNAMIHVFENLMIMDGKRKIQWAARDL